jgi:hypothetical protein
MGINIAHNHEVLNCTIISCNAPQLPFGKLGKTAHVWKYNEVHIMV